MKTSEQTKTRTRAEILADLEERSPEERQLGRRWLIRCDVFERNGMPYFAARSADEAIAFEVARAERLGLPTEATR